MAKSKSDNQTQYIESIEGWFSDAQELAVNLLMLRQWRWHTRKELDSRVDETEQQIEFLASKSQSLANRFAEVWPGLKLAYCDLGDFLCEGLPAGRCGWVALQSLTERVMGWGKYLANEQQKRTLNCQEQVEFMERERWLSGVVDSIRARLLLEESKLLTTTPLVLTSAIPKKKTSGGVARPKRGSGELTNKQELFAAALRKWHGYENESLSCVNCTPITNEKLVLGSGSSKGKLTKEFFDRWLGDNGNVEYKRLCSRGSKALALAIAKLSREGALAVATLAVEALADANARRAGEDD